MFPKQQSYMNQVNGNNAFPDPYTLPLFLKRHSGTKWVKDLYVPMSSLSPEFLVF